MVPWPVGGSTGPVEGCGDLAVESGAAAASAGDDGDSAQSIFSEQCILALSFFNLSKASVKTSRQWGAWFDTDIAPCKTCNAHELYPKE
jgi:hypothetical protein